MIPLSWYLAVSAILFVIGFFGVLSRRNAIAILMGIELMLNAVNINVLAFWRYTQPENPAGLVWAIIVITVAAAEAAVGLALFIALYRLRTTVHIDEVDLLKG